jgi:hypothetical protein
VFLGSMRFVRGQTYEFAPYREAASSWRKQRECQWRAGSRILSTFELRRLHALAGCAEELSCGLASFARLQGNLVPMQRHRSDM